MIEAEISSKQLEVKQLLEAAIRDETPVPQIVRKLWEGLDATEVKTCSYQGNMTHEDFVDYVTRLAYIKAIIEYGGLSEVKSGSDNPAFTIERIGQMVREQQL